MQKLFVGILSLMLLTLVSCKDDDPVDPVASATFTVKIENAFVAKTFSNSGVFNTPVGATSPGPVMPGNAYEFTFYAGQGSYLSFATMFVQSNDLFYAPDDEGISLYDMNGNPISGDITDQIDLWDAGTEVNQEPGVGADQAPRQAGGNTGADENGTVELITNVMDGYTYPADNEVIKVTITPADGGMFTVRIDNVSDMGSFQTPFAPGGWAVHASGTPLFTEGEAAANGLEGVAEDGDLSVMSTYLTDNTGYVSPYAPGVWVIHESGAKPLFTDGQPDAGEGLEGLAEDGNAAPLEASLNGKAGVSQVGIFSMPVGSGAAGPLMPGGSYEFSFTAEEGAYLNFATMLVQTNDLFFAFEDTGLALFANGQAVEGDVTADLLLWDAGTEVNEYPGAGPNQAPRQAGPNTGTVESGNVQEVNDAFTYPATTDAIKVTITAQ